MPAWHDYRRWAFESAALDLALRQAGRSSRSRRARAAPRHFRDLEAPGRSAFGRPGQALARPLPDAPLQARPDQQLDGRARHRAGRDRGDRLGRSQGSVQGTVVDQPPDPELYRRVVEAFPDAWIEDPRGTDETRPILEPQAARITWDAPIHSIEDIEAVPWPPRTINIKPSRFGAVQRLFDAYDYCAEKGDQPLRRRPVGARPGPRADPVPRRALPSGHAERRRSRRLQLAGAAARAAGQPARALDFAHRLPLGGLTYSALHRPQRSCGQ